MNDKSKGEAPRPINEAPRDCAVIAWCPELAEWAVVEYHSTNSSWHETVTYTPVNPTHWLPIELPEIPQ